MENVGLMVALAGAMTKAPTAEQVSTAVDAWLDDHPEATTTVTDGAITNAKLASSFVTPGTAAAYSSSATYAVGDYVFYGGTLYRCITAITTAEAWTAAHWTAAVLGDDVGDLKNALNNINALNSDLLKRAVWEEGSINSNTGADTYSSSIIRTNYISLAGLNTISFSIDSEYKYLYALINADKTAVVNEVSWKTSSTDIDISDYPSAVYIRLLLQKRDNTKPDSASYLLAVYSTTLLDAIDNAIQYGEVTYGALAQELKDTLAYKYNDTAESLTFSNTNTLLKKDGTLVSYTGNNAVTDYIDCSSWLSFQYSGRQWYDGQCYAFYDNSKNFISSYPNSTSGVHDYSNIVVSIPQNAKYIRIANFSANATIVYISTAYLPSNIGYKWLGRKWCCIGDSLTEVNSSAAKRYHDYIADHTGITVVNLGVGGTGYMNGGSGSNPFRNRVSSIPIDSDVITIFGSFNDLGETRPLGTESDTGTDTIGGCINTTFDDIFTRIPLANVGVITPTPWGSAYPLDNESSNQYKYVQLLKDICERRGIPCLDLFHCSQLRPWDSDFKAAAYSNDNTGVHPDENGHKLIAPRFEGFLDTLLLV